MIEGRGGHVGGQRLPLLIELIIPAARHRRGKICGEDRIHNPGCQLLRGKAAPAHDQCGFQELCLRPQTAGGDGRNRRIGEEAAPVPAGQHMREYSVERDPGALPGLPLIKVDQIDPFRGMPGLNLLAGRDRLPVIVEKLQIRPSG